MTGYDPGGTHPEQAEMLAWLARMVRAETIVEAGTYKGMTACALGLANPDATVWTADLVRKPIELPPNVIYHVGLFEDMLTLIEEPICFAYIDASGPGNTDPALRARLFELVRPRLRPNGIIAVDDTWDDWPGAAKIRSYCQLNLRALKGLSLYQHI